VQKKEKMKIQNLGDRGGSIHRIYKKEKHPAGKSGYYAKDNRLSEKA